MAEDFFDGLSVAILATRGIVVSQGEWLVTWSIENQTDATLSIHEVRIPHDQFGAIELSVEQSFDISPRTMCSLTTKIHYDEPPGSTLTYPFVIIRADWNRRACRLFGRLRIEADEQGYPQAICEEVTIRPVIAG